MSYKDKLKRWAEKQGWFVWYEGEQHIIFILPDGVRVRAEFDSMGEASHIGVDYDSLFVES